MPLDLSTFHCLHCHACCRVAGYVRLRSHEPDAIAAFLSMEVNRFIQQYTRVTADRTALSLTEKRNGHCVFLFEGGCGIHPAKPLQCRQFPHGWRFSGFETICGWAKKQGGDHNPRMLNPSSSSK